MFSCSAFSTINHRRIYEHRLGRNAFSRTHKVKRLSPFFARFCRFWRRDRSCRSCCSCSAVVQTNTQLHARTKPGPGLGQIVARPRGVPVHRLRGRSVLLGGKSICRSVDLVKVHGAPHDPVRDRESERGKEGEGESGRETAERLVLAICPCGLLSRAFVDLLIC